MKCPECGHAMKSERRDHLYVESGLPNVMLLGLEFRVCPSCGEEDMVMPRLAQLHKVIAKALAEKKERLTGAEVRFLRKHLGWAGKDFAQIMGVTAEVVSRWENDHQPIGGGYERALRLAALRTDPVDSYPTERLGDITESERPVSLRLSSNAIGWRAEVAA